MVEVRGLDRRETKVQDWTLTDWLRSDWNVVNYMFETRALCVLSTQRQNLVCFYHHWLRLHCRLESQVSQLS